MAGLQLCRVEMIVFVCLHVAHEEDSAICRKRIRQSVQSCSVLSAQRQEVSVLTITPHAFVAMPFGAKPGPDGHLIDFNRIYNEYIQTAGTGGG